MPAPLPLDSSNPADIWVERLYQAFADASRTSGFLTLAESAVEACPGDPTLLTLATTAALLDERPERALAFLKRLSKRYTTSPTDHLLHALALFQNNKRVAARALLVSHELTEWPAACRAFPGGRERVRWLLAQLDAVMDRDNAAFGRRPAAMRSKSRTKPTPRPRPAGRSRLTAPAVAKRQTVPLPPPLPQIHIDIPFRVEFDLAPLMSAATHAPEQDGR